MKMKYFQQKDEMNCWRSSSTLGGYSDCLV